MPEPVPKSDDSVAAQYARAKAELTEKLAKAETGAEAVQRKRRTVFGYATAWGIGFWVWML